MILYTVKILPNTDVVHTEVRQTRRGCEWARGWAFKTGRTDLVFGRSGQREGRHVVGSTVDPGPTRCMQIRVFHVVQNFN